MDQYNRSAWIQILAILFVIVACIALIVGFIWFNTKRPSQVSSPVTLHITTATVTQNTFIPLVIDSIPTPTALPMIIAQTPTYGQPIPAIPQRWIVNMVWDNYTTYNGVDSDVAEFIPEGMLMQSNPPISRFGVCETPELDNPTLGEIYLFNAQTNYYQPEDGTGQIFKWVTFQEGK